MTESGLKTLVAVAAAGLVLARWAAELWLQWLNRTHGRACTGSVPEPVAQVMDAATYARSVEYTQAKSRFRQWAVTWETVVLLALLFSGLLPRSAQWFGYLLGTSVWAQAAWVWTIGLVLGLSGLPLAWYQQFHLEARFGFNTASPRLWWTDQAKGLALAMALGYPLAALVLGIFEWTGTNWWIWAWAFLLIWQGLMLWLVPTLILPWFNKFTPLPDGPLRDRLLALAQRLHFPVAGLYVMDGSRRSRHSNAFLTGLGRWRRIVLWDTLLAQLTDAELEAVLAHEIGHARRRHSIKLLACAAAGLLVALAVVAWLARQPWFYAAFGFRPGSVAPVLALGLLLGSTAGFWLLPVLNGLSRRFEFQADAFAAAALGSAEPLVTALRRLSEKNLANLTPHPLYSRIYYSHPTLLEREQALRRWAAEAPACSRAGLGGLGTETH